VQSEAQIREDSKAAPSWYSAQKGLFSSEPHIVLQENFWSEEKRASTVRFSVIVNRGQDTSVAFYALSNEAYSENELVSLLESVGFVESLWFPSLTGDEIEEQCNIPVIVARK